MFWQNTFASRLLQNCRMRERVNPFAHIDSSTLDDFLKHDEQFLLFFFSQKFLLYTIIILSFIEIFYILELIVSKSTPLLYVGKGFKHKYRLYCTCINQVFYLSLFIRYTHTKESFGISWLMNTVMISIDISIGRNKSFIFFVIA